MHAVGVPTDRPLCGLCAVIACVADCIGITAQRQIPCSSVELDVVIVAALDLAQRYSILLCNIGHNVVRQRNAGGGNRRGIPGSGGGRIVQNITAVLVGNHIGARPVGLSLRDQLERGGVAAAALTDFAVDSVIGNALIDGRVLRGHIGRRSRGFVLSRIPAEEFEAVGRSDGGDIVLGNGVALVIRLGRAAVCGMEGDGILRLFQPNGIDRHIAVHGDARNCVLGGRTRGPAVEIVALAHGDCIREGIVRPLVNAGDSLGHPRDCIRRIGAVGQGVGHGGGGQIENRADQNIRRRHLECAVGGNTDLVPIGIINRPAIERIAVVLGVGQGNSLALGRSFLVGRDCAARHGVHNDIVIGGDRRITATAVQLIDGDILLPGSITGENGAAVVVLQQAAGIAALRFHRCNTGRSNTDRPRAVCTLRGFRPQIVTRAGSRIEVAAARVERKSVILRTGLQRQNLNTVGDRNGAAALGNARSAAVIVVLRRA